MSIPGIGDAFTVPQRFSPTTPVDLMSSNEYLSVRPILDSRAERQSKTRSGITASSRGCALPASSVIWPFESVSSQTTFSLPSQMFTFLSLIDFPVVPFIKRTVTLVACCAWHRLVANSDTRTKKGFIALAVFNASRIRPLSMRCAAKRIPYPAPARRVRPPL